MNEKRKHKRIPLKLELSVSSLFKQDFETIPNIDTNLEVKNISKSGIGFESTNELPLDYYFDARIQLTEEQFFLAIVKIVRVEKIDEMYLIGCEFVGLADMLSQKIDMYEAKFEE